MKSRFFALIISILFSLGVIVSACTTLTDADSAQGLTDDHELDDFEGEQDDDPGEEPKDDPVVEDPVDPDEEVCDGEDNDGDGEIDEGTDGGECETPEGDIGTEVCIAGWPRCQTCDPGTIREVNCGCGIDRTDLCDSDGVWRRGACDPCEEDEEPMPCGFCGVLDANGMCVGEGVCQPEDISYRRCDSCPEETGCGPATCVGEKWQCTASCEWEMLEGCGIRPSECERDAKRIDPCGQCGSQVLTCDGCFWNRSDCKEQGSCFPGDFRKVPCYDKNCTEGWGNYISCDGSCEWIEGKTCTGCTPGIHTEMVDCVYRHPRCGKRELQYECVIQTESTPCEPSIGSKINYVYLSQCPPIDCYPGQVSSEGCMLDSGEGGTITKKCTNACEWPVDGSPCTAVTSSCVPGTKKVKETDCGCEITYTTTETCREDGLGWTTVITGREDCPECEEGDGYDTSCTADQGMCGTSKVSCSDECEWVQSECKPRADACVPGDTVQRSCNSLCGTGHGTYTCIGCNWYMTGECVPDVAGNCLPGDSRTVQCNPDGCPQQEDVCSEHCQWIEGSCPACG